MFANRCFYILSARRHPAYILIHSKLLWNSCDEKAPAIVRPLYAICSDSHIGDLPDVLDFGVPNPNFCLATAVAIRKKGEITAVRRPRRKPVVRFRRTDFRRLTSCDIQDV